jgi:2-polyprenyl-6-methoxyphenol hydroxylase-like FAD-dependent oxidoreductase
VSRPDRVFSGGHIMAYPIRAHQLYNMVLIHPSRPDVVESWTSTGPRKHLDEFYANWSPTLRKLLALVDDQEIPEWNLRIHKPLATWVEGNVALMGDACHPTLPYVAQGAAQAVEDAGVLAVVLSMCEKKELSELFDQCTCYVSDTWLSQSTLHYLRIWRSARLVQNLLWHRLRGPDSSFIYLMDPSR